MTKVEGKPDARKVTIDGIDGKVWEGPTEQEAITAARKGAEQLFEDRAQTSVPRWIQDENARAAERLEEDTPATP